MKAMSPLWLHTTLKWTLHEALPESTGLWDLDDGAKQRKI